MSADFTLSSFCYFHFTTKITLIKELQTYDSRLYHPTKFQYPVLFRSVSLTLAVRTSASVILLM
jgi:hypothetical protein